MISKRTCRLSTVANIPLASWYTPYTPYIHQIALEKLHPYARRSSTLSRSGAHSDESRKLPNDGVAKVVSLSGCGFLIPFHVGVIKALERNGKIGESTIFSGASGGALVAAAYTSGLGCDEIMDIFEDVYDYSIRNGVWGKLGEPLLEACDSAIPEDGHERASGRLVVAVHRVSPFQLQPLMIDQFSSKADMIRACYCSSFLPMLLEPAATCAWRGQLWTDGGLLHILPPIPAHITEQALRPACVPSVIRSLPFPLLARMRTDRETVITFSDQLRGHWSELQLAIWAVSPPSNQRVLLSDLLKAGEESAEHWLAHQTCK